MGEDLIVASPEGGPVTEVQHHVTITYDKLPTNTSRQIELALTFLAPPPGSGPPPSEGTPQDPALKIRLAVDGAPESDAAEQDVSSLAAATALIAVNDETACQEHCEVGATLVLARTDSSAAAIGVAWTLRAVVEVFDHQDALTVTVKQDE